MAKTTEIKLGYGGGASINVNGGSSLRQWCSLIINSASFTMNTTLPTFSAYNMGLEYINSKFNVREDVALGKGLLSFSGSLNFALTKSSLNSLFNQNFLTRNNIFDIIVNDGRTTLSMQCCYWNNFSISGNPRQILTASLQFISTNNQLTKFNISNQEEILNPKKFFEESQYIKYWQTGAKNVESFNITFSREVNPVYLNTNYRCPSYIRVGKLSLSGNVSSWVDLIQEKAIYIADKKLTLKGIVLNDSSSFNFEGIDDTGKYNYSFKMYNKEKSSDEPWEITDNSTIKTTKKIDFGDY